MKNIVKFLTVSLITLSLLVACGGSGGSSSGDKVQLGVASTQTSKENEGVVTFDTIVAAVVMKDDKVAYVSIDELEQKATAENGKFEIEVDQTKGTKKDAYGMKNAPDNTLGKEWFEQIEAVQNALVSKTKDEVKAYFESEEVKSSATIYIDAIAQTVLKALDNTTEAESVAKVGLGTYVSVSTTDDAVKSVLDYALVAVDSDGKITKVLLDNAEEGTKLDGETVVLQNIAKTKAELKEAYGLKEFAGEGSIQKEWFEQNEALMDYFTGKTIDEVGSLDGNPKENTDINSSVSINIGGAQAAIRDAGAKLADLK